jgi:hypothetical protein
MPEDPNLIEIGNEPFIAPGVRGYTVDNGRKGLYVPLVIAENEGSGDVGRYLDSLPKDRRVVFPNVLSKRLVGMLSRRGFTRGSEWGGEMWGVVDIWVRKP